MLSLKKISSSDISEVVRKVSCSLEPHMICGEMILQELILLCHPVLFDIYDSNFYVVNTVNSRSISVYTITQVLRIVSVEVHLLMNPTSLT